jgi:hypothetical protein
LLVKSVLLIAASALALATLPAPAAAQMHMPGMTMPMPAKAAAKKPAAKKATSKKRLAPKKAGRRKAAAKISVPRPAAANRPVQHDMTVTPDHGNIETPMPVASTPTTPMDHSQMDHGAMQMPMATGEHAGHAMAMPAALGPYPITRESSGTAWQPDTSEHMGLMKEAGDWKLMAHGVLNLVYDHQGGTRGDDKAFASGMLMGMAQRRLGNGTLQFKAMVSPDPMMGRSGYPLLLASGETANGRDRLIDRQHPHDFFMELSGSVSQNIGSKSSVFLYAGLPGEPAFGPPAFMHREAILDSPEAPITHHWLDSTHISFGVLTGGMVVDRVKLEISRFNGREPNQYRWDIETSPLDSTAIRLSWNPIRTLALQGSWGHFTDPEQLEPGVDQERWSASALWANEIAPGWKLAGTLAWGRKTAHGHNDDALAAEAALKHAGWTLFGRGEIAENRELTDVEDSPAYRVGKVSLGAVRDFRIAEHWSLGAGGLFSVNFVPDALAPLYGEHNPTGAMGFIRLKLD